MSQSSKENLKRNGDDGDDDEKLIKTSYLFEVVC